MRVAVVTESFLPQVDGVTNSVCRVLEHLQQTGHQALVVAPAGARGAREQPAVYAGAPVLRAPSAPLPGYPEFRFATPWPKLLGVLDDFGPDVVHLAAPAGLGAQAAFAARRLDVPSVAVYQTDIAGFAARYGLGHAERAIWRWLSTVHRLAARTLAPSWDAVDVLTRQGVQRVARWARGVDLERFNPRHRDEALRAALAPDGEVLVGYVGRLAKEKRPDLLAALDGLPGCRLVVVGDGPMRPGLERTLGGQPAFLGFLSGQPLSAAVASLDVFVHTGALETFCQAAQEAKASGVPVVAPAAGGLLDVVEHGSTGLHYPAGRGAALRDRVASLTSDPDRRHAMGLAARASVAGCGWDAVGDELLAHYRDVTGSSGAQPSALAGARPRTSPGPASPSPSPASPSLAGTASPLPGRWSQ